MLLSVLAIVAGGLLFSATASAQSARVWLSRPSGAVVPENGSVKVGEALTVHVAGFAANAVVLLQFGSIEVAAPIETDGSGAGSSSVRVPQSQPDAYVLTASSDAASATTLVVVVTTTKPLQTPAPSHSSGGGGHTTSKSTTATLAHTGPSSTIGYWLAALTLLVVGGSLMRVAAPVVLGRHQRRAGAHRRD
jgi:hypothetical protein